MASDHKFGSVRHAAAAAAAADAVGVLQFHHTSLPGVENSSLTVYANQEFDLGRADVQRLCNVVDPTLSAHHLRFRCLVYDDDWDQYQVGALVYVCVLSSKVLKIIHSVSEGRGYARVISKNDGDVLLSSGDQIQLTRSTSISYWACDRSEDGHVGFNTIQQAEMLCFAREYQVIKRLLGVGGHAKVFVAVKQTTKRQLACKILHIPSSLPNGSSPNDRGQSLISQSGRVVQLSQEQLHQKRKLLAREFNILRGINHPNIVRLEKVFYGPQSIYIFQELMTGGDLLSYLDRGGSLGEPQAVIIVRQILEAVSFLHSSGIVHRDIKPENILLTSWRDGARVVLSDFGQAIRLNGAAISSDAPETMLRMHSIVGTRGYTAPEIIKLRNRRHDMGMGYSKAVDLWSVGCVTTVLLTNTILSMDYNQASSCETTADGAITDRKEAERYIVDYGEREPMISRNAKAFVAGCLAVKETDRLSAEEALKHRWIRHPRYKKEADNAYYRAIRDWIPRANDRCTIEYINMEAGNSARVASDKD